MGKKKIVEVAGWYGTIAIVLAYMLLSFSVLRSTDLAYQVLNVTGALGIVLDSFYKRDYQPAVLNIIWVFIGFFALLRIFL